MFMYFGSVYLCIDLSWLKVADFTVQVLLLLRILILSFHCSFNRTFSHLSFKRWTAQGQWITYGPFWTWPCTFLTMTYSFLIYSQHNWLLHFHHYNFIMEKYEEIGGLYAWKIRRLPDFGGSWWLPNRPVLFDTWCHLATGVEISQFLSTSRQGSESGIPRSWCVPYSTRVVWLGSTDASHPHDQPKIPLSKQTMGWIFGHDEISSSMCVCVCRCAIIEQVIVIDDNDDDGDSTMSMMSTAVTDNSGRRRHCEAWHQRNLTRYQKTFGNLARWPAGASCYGDRPLTVMTSAGTSSCLTEPSVVFLQTLAPCNSTWAQLFPHKQYEFHRHRFIARSFLLRLIDCALCACPIILSFNFMIYSTLIVSSI